MIKSRQVTKGGNKMNAHPKNVMLFDVVKSYIDYFKHITTLNTGSILIIIAFFEVEFIYILPAVVIIGAATVSDIKFSKPGIKINAIATLLILLTLVLYDSYYSIAPLLLLTAIIIYAIVGPVYTKFLAK